MDEKRLAKIRQTMTAAIETRFQRTGRVVCPRLRTMALYIQAVLKLEVEIVRGHYRGDRKPRGFRYTTSRGQDRYGTRLIVRDADDQVLLDHNSADTYRYNTEVAEWILRKEKALMLEKE